MKKGVIAILGCNEVSSTWALIHTAYGYDVILHDKDKQLLLKTAKDLRERIFELRKEFHRGDTELETRLDLIHVSCDLKETVRQASFIQECLEDNLCVKREVIEIVDTIIKRGQIVLSNTAHILPSALFADLEHESQFIVSHAVEPATLCPVVEIVPGPKTSPDTVQKTRNFHIENEQMPICLSKEIEGFAINRLQYALISEGLRMVQDGLFKLQDFETIVKQGLGLRWAFAGPLETVTLNREGIIGKDAPFSDVFRKVSKSLGYAPDLHSPALIQAGIQLALTSPASNAKVRQQYRDLGMARLGDLKEGLEQLDQASKDIRYPKHKYSWMSGDNTNTRSRA